VLHFGEFLRKTLQPTLPETESEFDTFLCAKEIDYNRDRRAPPSRVDWQLEEKCRAVLAKNPLMQGRHFVNEGDRLVNSHQQAALFELPQESLKISMSLGRKIIVSH
jgi:hypothetical protein